MDTVNFLAQFNEDIKKMKAQAPDTVGAFANLFNKTMGEGALTVKQKELIALAVALAVQCKPCIALHVKKSIDAGATKEQMIEACGVSVLMAGGPAYTNMPEVINAIEDISS